MKKIIMACGLIALLLILAGCSGTVMTVKSPPCATAGAVGCEKCGCKGVPVRLMEPTMEWYVFTTAVDVNSKKQISCTPELLPRFVSAPSKELYYIYYDAAVLFEKHKLSVALNADGTLKSVNTESVPADLPKEVLKEAVRVAAGGQGADKTLCNAGPVAVFGQCPIDDKQWNCKKQDDGKYLCPNNDTTQTACKSKVDNYFGKFKDARSERGD